MDIRARMVQPRIDIVGGVGRRFGQLDYRAFAGGAFVVSVLALCTASILAKHNSIFFWWAFFVGAWGVRKAMARIVVPVALWGLSFAPYLPEGLDRIVERVFLYGSWHGQYGFQLVLPKSLNALLFVAVMLLVPIFMRRRGMKAVMIAAVLCYFVFAHGMGYNQFVMAITLLSALAPAAALFMSIACFPLFLQSGMVWVYQARMNGAWFVSVAALIFHARRNRGQYARNHRHRQTTV